MNDFYDPTLYLGKDFSNSENKGEQNKDLNNIGYRPTIEEINEEVKYYLSIKGE